MNGVHDMGGMQGVGPIQREQNELMNQCSTPSGKLGSTR